MLRLITLLLLATLAIPAAQAGCSNGKCPTPRQREAMRRQAMISRLSKPTYATPAIQRLNQQILLLKRTNTRGQNNAQINGLQTQRAQLLRAQGR